VDVKKLGRELNVRYVLEGSVQRGGNRLRVNVQLIDAETGQAVQVKRIVERRFQTRSGFDGLSWRASDPSDRNRSYQR
jgi:TolB-like protein